MTFNLTTFEQTLTVLLPFVAALASYAIQQCHYKTATNTRIAITTILFVTIGSLFLQGKLTGNIASDTLLVLGTATALQSKELAPLQEYLKANFFAQIKQDVPPPLPPSTTQPLENVSQPTRPAA